MPTRPPPKVGDVVKLAARRRFQCPRCIRYMPSGSDPTCTSCGAHYTEVGGGYYLLEAV